MSWLQSYLASRTQSVHIGNHSSACTPCTSGVPQGSVLGPLLFSIYTSPVANIARSFNIHHQQYADDTQLYIALDPSDQSNCIARLSSCLQALHDWFCLNGMALNPDKSDAVLLGTRQRSRSYSHLSSVEVAGHSVLLSDDIKVLGVTLDSYLTMDKHISTVCKSAFYHIRSLRHIRSVLTDEMAKSIAFSLVCSRLDYANSLLYGTTQKNIARLQRVQNTLAKVVAGHIFPSHTHSSIILNHLHWLPIDYRIRFKLAVLTHSVLFSGQPEHLRSVLSHYCPSRSLRSSNTNQLSVPLVRTVFGSRGFSVAAPTVWNSLPAEVRTCPSSSTFRRLLKTHFFQQAFSCP